MKEITVSVPEGLGDIFWVHQLLVRNVDCVRYQVLNTSVGDPERRHRADAFLRILPRVTGVTHTIVSPEEYAKMASSQHDLSAVIRDGGTMSVNAPLESGQRLEALAGGHLFAETVLLPTTPCYLPNEYICAYVSGSTMLDYVRKAVGLWDIHQWAELLRGFYQRYQLQTPLVLIGASYDKEAMDALSELLADLNLRILKKCDLLASQVCHVLQSAKVFIGYQSGLSVLADQFDRRQIMMYFPHLNKMRLSWPKKGNIDSGKYQSTTFDKTPREVLESITWQI